MSDTTLANRVAVAEAELGLLVRKLHALKHAIHARYPSVVHEPGSEAARLLRATLVQSSDLDHALRVLRSHVAALDPEKS
jgi:hypothetical protein